MEMEDDKNMLTTIWGNFSQGIFEYAIDAYSNLEPWTFPLIFIGIIGYVYSATHSIVTMVAAILITFGIYATTTDIFNDVPDISLLMSLISIIGISALVFTLFIRKVVK